MAARRRRRYSLFATPRADRHIVAARRWWLENRPAAANALESELRASFRLLMDHPEIGRIATDVRGFGVRRLLLPNTKYVLYYRVSESDRAIHVLGFWHAHRGATPRL